MDCFASLAKTSIAVRIPMTASRLTPPIAAPEICCQSPRHSAAASWCSEACDRFPAGRSWIDCAHPHREFGLREACAQASPEQFGGNLELRRQRFILGLDLGVGEKVGFQLFELDGHVISFARCSASSISARGVFCVFVTKARTTTTLRQIAGAN